MLIVMFLNVKKYFLRKDKDKIDYLRFEALSLS